MASAAKFGSSSTGNFQTAPRRAVCQFSAPWYRLMGARIPRAISAPTPRSESPPKSSAVRQTAATAENIAIVSPEFLEVFKSTSSSNIVLTGI